MPPSKHALLGPSSAERWMNCPPSARLTENMPDPGSEYAAAGSLAHEIAEVKARAYFLEPTPRRTLTARINKLKKSEHYDKSMDSATDIYLETLQRLAMSREETPFVALETQLDISHIVPECFGTADCIMIGGGILDVVDYKNGSGVPVEAENNPQMMLYACGALRLYGIIYGDSIRTVRMTIVQPNAGGVKSCKMPVEQLNAWASEYAEDRAHLAWEGRGDFCPGDWCRFCRAKAQCRARAEKMLELEPLIGSVPAGGVSERADGAYAENLLTDEEVGDVLTRAKNLSKWVENLEAYALSAALDGRSVAGWKAVEGRGSRDWIGGSDAAFEALQSRGVPEALLYERKPVSVAGLEKALGKKEFTTAAEGLWEKSPGKPTLAPESDKRKPYSPAAAAFEVVADE